MHHRAGIKISLPGSSRSSPAAQAKVTSTYGNATSHCASVWQVGCGGAVLGRTTGVAKENPVDRVSELQHMHHKHMHMRTHPQAGKILISTCTNWNTSACVHEKVHMRPRKCMCARESACTRRAAQGGEGSKLRQPTGVDRGRGTQDRTRQQVAAQVVAQAAAQTAVQVVAQTVVQVVVQVAASDERRST